MYRKLIFVAIFLISCIVVSLDIKSISDNKDKYISIEVKGEVNNPGIYEVKYGSKVDDILKMAGVNKDSDLSSISNLNTLYNNEVIVIPRIDESTSELISINSASVDELVKLPGIGEGLAKRIIDYRNSYGSFMNLEDLKNVNGIGDAKYNKLKEYICL